MKCISVDDTMPMVCHTGPCGSRLHPPAPPSNDGRCQPPAHLPHELHGLDVVKHQQQRRLLHVEEGALQRVQEAVVGLGGREGWEGVWGEGGGGAVSFTQLVCSLGRGGMLALLTLVRLAGKLAHLHIRHPRPPTHLEGAAHGVAGALGVAEGAGLGQLGARQPAQHLGA